VHEIFISYSSKHRVLTRALADAIEAQYGAGSVWWDRELESRASYSEQIKAALEKARVIVVVWTAGAMISDYVYAEAVGAQASGKLVNVRPADISFRQIPEPFNIHHIDDAEDHARILSTIAKVMGGTPIPTRVPLHEIYFRNYGRRLIDPKQLPLPANPQDIAPTDLLQAKYAVVPYVDVTGMKADLVAWCRDGARAQAGRLVHGAGGLGKTRLMIEVAAALRTEGWMAGFLDRPHDLESGALQQRWQALEDLFANCDDRLLLVMDYAEARRDEVKAIAECLSRVRKGTRAIRLVLLARTAGEWWTVLSDETPEIGLLFHGVARGLNVIELPALAAGLQRCAIFDESLKAFAPMLAAQGYVLPAGDPVPERLARIEDQYARPLALQMEAMLWLACAVPESENTGVDDLLRSTLAMERAHWQKLLGVLDDDHRRDIARGVAQVTAIQVTTTRRSTEDLLLADRAYAGMRTARMQVDPLVRDLSRLYGRPDGGVARLEPDLVGEHHVALTADSELVDGCLAWIATEPVEKHEKRRRNILTVLQRATHPDHGEAVAGASALLDRLIGARTRELAADLVAVMIDTPGVLAVSLLRQIEAFDEETLAALDDALPLRSLNLMELSLRVAERRADLARSIAANAESEAAPELREAILSHLAARAGTLGIRLSALGRREEAQAASLEAVDIYRGLAETRPDVFLPDLAMSLNNLGIRLSHLDRREEAQAASQEAVDIYRRLVDTGSDTLLSALASSLSNLGGDLSNLGRREEALAVSQEAVDIYRRLAETGPSVFLPDLAMSLNNLGIRLSNLGRHEEALSASLEAVDIRKHLVETRPDAFLPSLAMSLNNLGIRHSNLGRREEALAASQEAVSIRRRLAEIRPDAFLPDLASGLNNVGEDLSRLGRCEEAFAATQEAVNIYRRLIETGPDVFLPDLAMSLSNLGICLSKLSRCEESLAVSQEAVIIYRRLAETRPDVFIPDLAMSLGGLGQAIAQMERHADAAAVFLEGVMSIVPFVEQHALAFSDLTRGLVRDYGVACEKAGTAPDTSLLERVGRALDGGPAADEASVLKAKLDTLLDTVAKTGALNEAALAELPAALADQLRAAWVATEQGTDPKSHDTESRDR